jgi:hypothetical protein
MLSQDKDGKSCEINIFTAAVSYPDEKRTLTQRIVDEIVKESDEYIGADLVDDEQL